MNLKWALERPCNKHEEDEDEEQRKKWNEKRKEKKLHALNKIHYYMRIDNTSLVKMAAKIKSYPKNKPKKCY